MTGKVREVQTEGFFVKIDLVKGQSHLLIRVDFELTTKVCKGQRVTSAVVHYMRATDYDLLQDHR